MGIYSWNTSADPDSRSLHLLEKKFSRFIQFLELHFKKLHLIWKLGIQSPCLCEKMSLEQRRNSTEQRRRISVSPCDPSAVCRAQSPQLGGPSAVSFNEWQTRARDYKSSELEEVALVRSWVGMPPRAHPLQSESLPSVY